MELKDTVALMVSPDRKQRFQAEYFQLKYRVDKLADILEKWDKGTLRFTPTCPRILLEEQLGNMVGYLSTLALRAQLEGIDLKEEDI